MSYHSKRLLAAITSKKYTTNSVIELKDSHSYRQTIEYTQK